MKDVDALDAAVEKLWDELVALQERKLLALAREMRPTCTWDDLLQPQDIPEIANDPVFNYEDGYLAGLKAARISLRARILTPLRDAARP
jgi:hypothetical protein